MGTLAGYSVFGRSPTSQKLAFSEGPLPDAARSHICYCSAYDMEGENICYCSAYDMEGENICYCSAYDMEGEMRRKWAGPHPS
jgi:hypothetical protein